MDDQLTDDDVDRLLEEPGGDATDKKDSEPPPELTNDVVIHLAGLTPLQYAQQLGREAKKYRTPVKLLEKAVEAVRTEQEAEKLLEPHWEVNPAEDPVDAAQLFEEIEARILQHVVMPKDLAFVVALWVGQSWVHQHGTYSPILGVTSAERDSGKSTLMGVIAFLVRRSLLSVSVSAAALYRSIEKWNPTFVVDEADDAFVDNPDLRQVINSGWTRGQGVMRCDPDTNEPRRFPTFCPKAAALKGKKMPDTMLSRTIFIEMKRRLRSEKVDHFRHLDDAGFARMRSQLARWAQDTGEALGLAQPAQPEGFLNRTASNWQLMFAIADSLGEEAGARARAIAQHIAGVTDMASAGVALLQDIKTMFEASDPRPPDNQGHHRAPDGGPGEAVGGMVAGQAHHRKGRRRPAARVPHQQPNRWPAGSGGQGLPQGGLQGRMGSLPGAGGRKGREGPRFRYFAVETSKSFWRLHFCRKFCRQQRRRSTGEKREFL